MKTNTLLALSCCLHLMALGQAPKTTRPNVLIILADDLGIGDVSAYQKGKLHTPNIDKLANGGVRFTNGYATSATCTPSRFALLTGRYPWHNAKAKVLPGDAPMLIDTAMFTLADLFKKQGYQTGVVGKWHLGLGNGKIDWNQPISETPTDLGFDYSYIMAATNDRVPTVYVENRQVKGLQANDPLLVSYVQNFPGEPTALTHPALMTTLKWDHGHNNSVHNGVPRIGFMKGGKAALWVDETMANEFLNQASAFISQRHPQKTGQPFFLYYALHQPHVPRVPNPHFVGKSGMGSRGDAILEADWCVGEIVQQLEQEGLLENTLIIFSSDNGPVLNDGYLDDAVEKRGNHDPFGGLRGGKYSLFEGGTRVPFVTYWKGHIQPQVSAALVCQIDFLASFAQLFQVSNPASESQNTLNAFLGKSSKGRRELVLEASGRLAFRQDHYALIPPHQGNAIAKDVNIELGVAPEMQLYDLQKDPGQQHNLAKEKWKKAKALEMAMQRLTQ